MPRKRKLTYIFECICIVPYIFIEKQINEKLPIFFSPVALAHITNKNNRETIMLRNHLRQCFHFIRYSLHMDVAIIFHRQQNKDVQFIWLHGAWVINYRYFKFHNDLFSILLVTSFQNSYRIDKY